MHKTYLTAYVDSDDEYFEDEEMAVRRFPLTYLADTPVDNVQLSDWLSPRYALDCKPSLLDVVLNHLVKPLSPSYCSNGHVPDDVVQMCHITQLQANDYVLEQSWRKYSWQGWEWLHNFETEEWFWKHPFGNRYTTSRWRRYRYKNAVWWLNGKRWFWEVNGLNHIDTLNT